MERVRDTETADRVIMTQKQKYIYIKHNNSQKLSATPLLKISKLVEFIIANVDIQMPVRSSSFFLPVRSCDERARFTFTHPLFDVCSANQNWDHHVRMFSPKTDYRVLSWFVLTRVRVLVVVYERARNAGLGDTSTVDIALSNDMFVFLKKLISGEKSSEKKKICNDD